jgi:hypothetical protein
MGLEPYAITDENNPIGQRNKLNCYGVDNIVNKI